MPLSTRKLESLLVVGSRIPLVCYRQQKSTWANLSQRKFIERASGIHKIEKSGEAQNWPRTEEL